MGSKTCSLFSFFCAAKGNWRNSIYIECSRCEYGRPSPCPGFLMIPDHDGRPIVLPAGIVQNMTGVTAEKDECRAALSRLDFEALYSLWLEWNISSPKECALKQVVCRSSCRSDNEKSQCCYRINTDA